MTSPQFQLLDEPWISTVGSDGRQRELSLRQVFTEAGSTARLAGDEPTQDLAILRLLLAIVHRAVADQIDDAEGALAVWARWWRSGLPVEAIHRYLERYRHRFDLFDPVAPFMQVADLETRLRPVGVEALIPQLWRQPHLRLFTDRRPRPLPFAEAARWVVHAHAVDPMGIKPAATGDPRERHGKVYPQSLAWLGRQTGLWLDGGNLARTILLNLVLAGAGEVEPSTDLPVWERPLPGPACDPTPPRGRADLLTWQSRRVRLRVAADEVTAVSVCYGDTDIALDQHNLEAMSIWSPSKRTGWAPLTTVATQAPWQRSAAMAAPEHAVPLREWITRLVEHDAMSADALVRVRWTSVEWGTMASAVAEIIDQADPYIVGALVDNTPAAARVLAAADMTGRMLSALDVLGQNLLLAAGADRERAQAGSTQEGDSIRFELEPRWGAWLPSHAPLREWWRTVDAAAREHGAALVDNAGPAALHGRELPDGTPMDTARAHAIFRAVLDRVQINVAAGLHPLTELDRLGSSRARTGRQVAGRRR